MSPTVRNLLTSFLIAAVAPIGLAALDLEQPAFAKNGNGGGNGGGHGGGNGGGHGGGNGGGHGHANGHAKNAGSAAETETEIEENSLSPNALGKLNGVLSASPQAIAHANINSPIGTARAFGEALADLLGAEEETEGEPLAEGEEETDEVTVEELGEMMANMTNKPVTAEQVEAVAAKVGVDLGEEAEGEVTEGEVTEGEVTEGEEPAEPEPSLAQQIADEANEIHGFTDEADAPDDADDSDDTDETADADDTTDDTDETTEVVN